MICQGHRKIDNNSARRLAESARRLAEYVLDNGRDDLGAAASRRGETIPNRHRYSGKGKGRGKSNASNSTSGRRYTPRWSDRNDSWRTPRAGPSQHNNRGRVTLRPSETAKPTTSTGRRASDSGKGAHSKPTIHKSHLKGGAYTNRPR